MSYKITRGVVYRDDIYDENDTQRDTFIDFGGDDTDNYIALATSGSAVLAVNGDAVGIGTTSPGTGLSACALDVVLEDSSPGEAYPVARFKNPDGPARVIIDAKGGTDARLYFADGGAIQWEVGNDETSHNFRIRDATDDTHLTITQGGTCTFLNDAQLTPLFGIAGTPTSTLHTHGSLAAEVSSVTGTSNDIDARHHTVLMGSDDQNCTVTLPTATGCAGRIYVFKRLAAASEGRVVKVDVQTNEYIDGDQDAELTFDTQYDIKSVQSDGTQWWIIGEVHMGDGP